MTNNTPTKAEAGKASDHLRSLLDARAMAQNASAQEIVDKAILSLAPELLAECDVRTPTVTPDLKAALGKIVSTCADRRDIFPDTETALSVITDELNEIYARLENTIVRGVDAFIEAIIRADPDCRGVRVVYNPNGGWSVFNTPPVQQSGAEERTPVPMILHCPACHLQHIDEPDERTAEWDNPPHRSHLCHGCGCIWRPADIATEGVASIATVGKADTWTPTSKETLQVGTVERVEAVARIIDPSAWDQRARHHAKGTGSAYIDDGDEWDRRADDVVKASLVKADAILKALSAMPEQFAENAKNSDGMREENARLRACLSDCVWSLDNAAAMMSSMGMESTLTDPRPAARAVLSHGEKG